MTTAVAILIFAAGAAAAIVVRAGSLALLCFVALLLLAVLAPGASAFKLLVDSALLLVLVQAGYLAGLAMLAWLGRVPLAAPARDQMAIQDLTRPMPPPAANRELRTE